MELHEGRTTANGIEFAHLEAGTGPLALCLHGFPDSPRGWQHLLPALAEAGYRAVAPWLRGYAPTQIPPDGSYQQGALAADATALHEALGGDADAVLIGHDWGASAVYPAVNHAPERWRAAVAMAVPPPAAMASGFLTFDQLRRSWYMFFFQHPLAEVVVVAADDLAFIDRLWADWSPGFDAGVATKAVKDALRDPANLAAALGYYRATIGGVGRLPQYDEIEAKAGLPVEIPLLYLHGRDDGCIGVELTEGAEATLHHERSRVEVVDGAGHFLQLERPDEIARLVLEFLS